MIHQKVKSFLKERTEELKKDAEELGQIEAGMRAGKYSQEDLLKRGVKERYDELKRQIRRREDQTAEEARQLVRQYQKEVRSKEALDPEEVNKKDLKILNSGIELNEKDLVSMLDRNQGNRTMTQTVFRFAKKNGIELPAKYVSSEKEAKEAEAVFSAIDSYCGNWIGTGDAGKILDRFFPNMDQPSDSE